MCGIRNPATRKKLLSEDRTFQQALEVAIADEIAAKESVQVQQQLPHIQSVNSVSKNSTASSSSSVDSVSKNLQFRRPLAGILVYLLYAKVFVQIRLRLPSRIRTLVFHVEMHATCDPNANLEMLHVATVTRKGILLMLAGRME